MNEVVRNKASIYFDYNPAIVTNYAESKVQLPAVSDTNLLEYRLVPNPVREDLFVKWTFYPTGPLTAQMISTTGQVCLEKIVVPEAGTQPLFKTNGLQSGVYTVRFLAKNGLKSSTQVVIIH